MAWGGSPGSGAGGWAYGGVGAGGFDPVMNAAIDARAARAEVQRAAERGDDTTQLERAAEAAESLAWRIEQEAAAEERGQLEEWAAIYGYAPHPAPAPGAAA